MAESVAQSLDVLRRRHRGIWLLRLLDEVVLEKQSNGAFQPASLNETPAVQKLSGSSIAAREAPRHTHIPAM